MYTIWFKALLATPPTICGLRLRPFSLGHRFALRNLGNPYVIGGASSRPDLLTALQVCSRSMAQVRAFLGGGVRPFYVGLWAWRWRRARLETMEASFRQYVEDFSGAPEYTLRDPENSTALHGPYELHLALTVAKAFGLPSLDAALDCPFALAACVSALEGERAGTVALMSEIQEFGMRFFKDAEAASAEGDKAKADELYATSQALFAKAQSQGGA